MISPSPVLVAFIPPSGGLGEDKLFYSKSYFHIGDVSHWIEPTRRLAQIGLSRGLEFHTDDLVNLKSASILIFGEMPSSRCRLERLRKTHPHLKFILQIIETPIGRGWVFDPANHTNVDAVVSYNNLLRGDKYFTFKIPAGGLTSHAIPLGMPWDKRKVACMVAHVPNPRPFCIRRSGLGVMRQGWKFTLGTWWNYVTEAGSLHSERLKIARQCEEALGDQFEIFGPGWPEVTINRNNTNSFYSARGAYKGNKLELLQRYRFTVAYENCLNDCGYITEKIFDAFLAGCVPIYLGNKSIQKYVPAEAFVDARHFRTRNELIKYIDNMSEGHWQTMRESAAAFLRNTAEPYFGSSQYAESIIGAVRYVLAGAPSRNL